MSSTGESSNAGGFPPQVTGFAYDDLYFYGEATRSVSDRESNCVSESRERHATRSLLKIRVTSVSCCPVSTSKEGGLPNIRTSENRPLWTQKANWCE
ncbi:MAG: hypothetical protein RM347_001285 [Nostoc sp. ChiQUE02]